MCKAAGPCDSSKGKFQLREPQNSHLASHLQKVELDFCLSKLLVDTAFPSLELLSSLGRDSCGASKNTNSATWVFPALLKAPVFFRKDSLLCSYPCKHKMRVFRFVLSWPCEFRDTFFLSLLFFFELEVTRRIEAHLRNLLYISSL